MGLKFDHTFKAFLLGQTQALYVLSTSGLEGTLCLCDVSTGRVKELGPTKFLDFEGDNIKLENYGWISLSNQVDFDTFGELNFTDEPIVSGAKLEAYFQFVMEKLNK